MIIVKTKTLSQRHPFKIIKSPPISILRQFNAIKVREKFVLNDFYIDFCSKFLTL